mmetsp:Transcript_31482/g.83943  ORF Transcript_31482/g.83943 Transcript_31482/m.83943 type:complete len:101 (+) Transcript_31482:241-543(+)
MSRIVRLVNALAMRQQILDYSGVVSVATYMLSVRRREAHRHALELLSSLWPQQRDVNIDAKFRIKIIDAPATQQMTQAQAVLSIESSCSRTLSHMGWFGP